MNASLCIESGRKLFAAGDYGRAEEQFLRALGADASQAGAVHMELGGLYRALGDHDRALKHYEDRAAAGRASPEILEYLGSVHREKGRMGPAADAFARALEALPGDDLFRRNKTLNDLEICQGKTLLESQPRAMGVTLTSRCNLRCVMCTSVHDHWELPRAAQQEVLSFLPYLEHIYWKGGEVQLYPDFEALFDAAARHPRLCQEISTNGLLLDGAWILRFVRNNVLLSLSIDGFTPGVYENIRKGGSFQTLMRNIRELNRCRKEAGGASGFHMNFNFVLMEQNCRELERIVAFAVDNEFSHIKISPVNASSADSGLPRLPLEFLRRRPDLKQEIFQEARRHGIDVFWAVPDCGPAPSAPGPSGPVPPPPLAARLCYLPWQHLSIGDRGRVLPHECFCREAVGDIASETLRHIWNNAAMRSYRARIAAGDYAGWCSEKCMDGTLARHCLGLRRPRCD